MKLTIVGCTGSFPGPGSPASCYLLTANDGERTWKVVMDLGSGALGAIQRYTDLEDIDAIFLTHLHPDHCMDLCGLHVAVRWKPGGWGRGRIPVWGPAATADRMATAYGLELDPGMREEFDFTNWAERVAVTVGPFTVTPFAVNHPIEESYALRVEVVEPAKDGTMVSRTLTYSGDTDSCASLEEAAKDADLFLCEATYQNASRLYPFHLSASQAGELGNRGGAGHLVLTHLTPELDHLVSIREAAETFDGPIDIAVPGMVLEVGR